MADSREYKDFDYLVIQCLEGVIGPEDFQKLDRMIASNSELARLYVNLISVNSELYKPGQMETFLLDESSQDIPFDRTIMEALAQYEKTAPNIEIPVVPKESEGDERPIEIKKGRPKVNKFSIYSLVLSSAALIFLIVYAHFAAMRQGVEVATLTDSMNAKWADVNTSMLKGRRLATGRNKFLLREGLANLRFDNEAEVTLEGPAEFQILTEEQIKLYYGRLFATIPQGAIGFSVNTPSARIIDLGTEFGIEAEVSGDTYLHVLQGKTTLIAGEKSNKVSIEVSTGIAKKISAVTSVISDVPCNEKLFVRSFDGDKDLVWRGENLKLASLVAGHDGFQEVSSLTGINPATGEFTSSIISDNRASKKAYNPVPTSEFIDGVFVPDGGQGPIIISSEGHTFDCPDTTGLFTHEIAAYKGSIENQHTTIEPAVFNGRKVENESIVMLHSNIGITFDLQAIRRSISGQDLKTFTAWGGLTEALKDSKDQPDIDFWILVDGQVKYEKKMLKIEDGTISLDIPLNPQDRFLTLIVTDGLRASDGKREFPFGNDFFYLINPELSLTTILNQ